MALDLTDERDLFGPSNQLGIFMAKLAFAIEKRQSDLERELAQARGIPLVYLGLIGKDPVPYWDFRHTNELIVQGYEIARRIMRCNIKG